MSTFVFESYHYDEQAKAARFTYRFENGASFTETVTFFSANATYDKHVLERVLFLAFILVGISYYKAAPTTSVSVLQGTVDEWQATFFSRVFQEGLSQFAFENNLQRGELATFAPTGESVAALSYSGSGVLSLQSGGKDSLLVAQMLKRSGVDFHGFYVSSTDAYPDVIGSVGSGLLLARRSIDHDALGRVKGRNGHVPVTYIVLAISLIQAVLSGASTVLAGIGHEGEEPHGWIGDLPVNHQWSKTWQAEQMFAEYVQRYISPDMRVGSPLRGMSELRVSQRFVELAWPKYSRSFSSCNVANYRQGSQNQQLSWCGECPKCANSYLLFSPFIDAAELQDIFGSDLYVSDKLQETFKGLLGVDGVMKPFECVGEIEELRYAYHQAQKRGGYGSLNFAVPQSESFSMDHIFPAQDFSDLFT